MIVKDAKGRYNFENTQEKSKKGQPGTAFSFSDLKVSNGSLVYLDKKTGEKTELKEINLAIGDLSIAGAPGLVIKNLSFAGTMECKELRRKDLKIDNIKSKIKGAQGTIYFNPLVMDIFGSKGEG